MFTALALAAALSGSQTARLDTIMRYVMREHEITALSVAVVREGRTTIRCYGTARARTRFAIGSLSKPFLAATVLRLARERVLSLDERVREIDPAFTEASRVTLQELLAQTSGIPDYASLPSFDRFVRAPIEPRALVAPVATRALQFEPGTDFDYSNTNYVLAGLAVERATHTSLIETLRRQIFDPLGMHETRRWLPLVTEHERARGSVSAGSSSLAFGAGDLESNATDMARWLRELLAPRVLAREDVARMTQAQRLRDGASAPYGMGFFTGAIFGMRAAAVSGYINGFSSYLALVPLKHTGVVLLANEDRVDLGPAAQSAIAAALDIPE